MKGVELGVVLAGRWIIIKDVPVVLDCHWYVRFVPTAVTHKVVLTPAQTVAPAGCAVIAVVAFTVRIAPAEFTGAVHALVRTQRYQLLFITTVTDTRFSEALLAPAILK